MELSQDKGWSRLEKVIKWSDMSANHFALHIGLNRAQNLYQIKNGVNGISKKLAQMVVKSFPDINIVWLITGKGEMFHSESPLSELTSYYAIDVEANIRNIENIEPTSDIQLPQGVEAQFAMIYRGGAMGQQIPPNTMVCLKEIAPKQILPGGEYLIVTQNFSMLRVVRQEPELTKIRALKLVAVQDGYDDILVLESQIERSYKVVAKLIINY